MKNEQDLIMQLANQKIVVFAVALIGLVSTARVVRYGGANPPKEVLKRIEETGRPMSCQAHVLPVFGKYVVFFICRKIEVKLTNSFMPDSFKLFFLEVQCGSSLIDPVLLQEET